MKEFDIFRNTDDMTVERIANIHPVLTNEEKERMFAMSERKFNITEKKFPQGGIGEMDDDDDVDGVEEYDRPAWLRYLSTAAALVLLGGGIALCKNLLQRSPAPENNNIEAPPVIATEIETGTTITSGADNSKYTTVSFDVDAILTAVSSAAPAPAAETTAAPATQAPTAAPAAQAPTEAPTTTAPSYDIEAYKQIAKDLETKWFKLARLNSYYYGNVDIDKSFKVHKVYEDGSVLDEPVYYVRGYDTDINTTEDYRNLHNSIFTDTPYLGDVYGAYPDEYCYTVHPIISDENGLLYHAYLHLDDIGFTPQSGFAVEPDDPSYILWHLIPEYEYNILGDTDVIIQNATADSFDAIVPACFYSPEGGLNILTPYDDDHHNYFADKWHIVNVNGEWRIELEYRGKEWVEYADYMSMLNAQ